MIWKENTPRELLSKWLADGSKQILKRGWILELELQIIQKNKKLTKEYWNITDTINENAGVEKKSLRWT